MTAPQALTLDRVADSLGALTQPWWRQKQWRQKLDERLAEVQRDKAHEPYVRELVWAAYGAGYDAAYPLRTVHGGRIMGAPEDIDALMALNLSVPEQIEHCFVIGVINAIAAQNPALAVVMAACQGQLYDRVFED